MLPDDAHRPCPLGAGEVAIILGKRIAERRAQGQDVRAELNQDETETGQHQMERDAAQCPEAGEIGIDGAADREQPEFEPGRKQQQDADARHEQRLAGDGEDLHRAIDPAAPMRGGEHAQWNP